MPTKVIVPPTTPKTPPSQGWNVAQAVRQLRTCAHHKQNNLCQADKTVADAITAGNPARKFKQVSVPSKSGPALEAHGFKPLHSALRTGPWKAGDIVVIQPATHIDTQRRISGYASGYIAMWDGTHWIGGYHFPAKSDVYVISPVAYAAKKPGWLVYRHAAAV